MTQDTALKKKLNPNHAKTHTHQEKIGALKNISKIIAWFGTQDICFMNFIWFINLETLMFGLQGVHPSTLSVDCQWIVSGLSQQIIGSQVLRVNMLNPNLSWLVITIILGHIPKALCPWIQVVKHAFSIHFKVRPCDSLLYVNMFHQSIYPSLQVPFHDHFVNLRLSWWKWGDVHQRSSGEYYGALVRHDTSLHLQRFRGPAVGLCLGMVRTWKMVWEAWGMVI